VTTDKTSVAVVGGGILGMTLALRLAQRGFKVTLIEAASRTGGLACPCEIGSYTWDQFYHVILLSDSSLRGLLGELGLEEHVHWGETRTGFYTDGNLYSMSNVVEFLTFPPLNMADRLRLGFTIFYASKIRSWKPLEEISVVDWLTRLSGKRNFDKVWLPLLKSKLGENYKLASASFIWAIIARMYAARRSGLKTEMFGYLDGGYATILGRFQECLDEKGIVTRCDNRVTRVADHNGRAIVDTDSGESLEFDKAVLTLPCVEMPGICPQLSPSEKKRLGEVAYQGVICASLILKEPLGGYYVTNITDEWVPFTGVIEMTALVEKDKFGGNSLAYLPCYLPQNHPFWQKSDQEILEISYTALETMYPSFHRHKVLGMKVTRARNVLPITTLNYSKERLPSTTTSLDHMFIVNSAQIPNGTMNVNEIVALGNRKASELTALFSESQNRTLPPRTTVPNKRTEAIQPLHQLDPTTPVKPEPNKPLASVSMDLDNQWSYMKTHGDPGWESFPSYLDVLIPQVLDILDRLDLKITFFIVGHDAALKKNGGALGQLTRRGHEVGNHSFRHEPWIHLYSRDEIRREILEAEEAILRVTGQKPIGFRGPGFSCSHDLIEALAENGYRYDASTLPTYLGPLARAYYFWSSNLTEKEKHQRQLLFGKLSEGLRPVKPYQWHVDNGARLLEIPVTTIPIFKTPFHLSYLLYLARFSRKLMFLYLKTALGLCRLTRTEPSFLLHPLDLLGGDQVPELRFFPGMDLDGKQKGELFKEVINTLSRHFNLVNMRVHAESILEGQGVRAISP
jgi:protoporphyrinogen oxidase/peptidoglycan/xylan/chitin deacetylase (PgdA/CDA1 family)